MAPGHQRGQQAEKGARRRGWGQHHVRTGSHLAADVGMAGGRDGEAVDAAESTPRAQHFEGAGVAVIVAHHDDSARTQLDDEPLQGDALVRGTGRAQRQRPPPDPADQMAVGVDGIHGSGDADSGGRGVRRGARPARARPGRRRLGRTAAPRRPGASSPGAAGHAAPRARWWHPGVCVEPGQRPV